MSADVSVEKHVKFLSGRVKIANAALQNEDLEAMEVTGEITERITENNVIHRTDTADNTNVTIILDIQFVQTEMNQLVRIYVMYARTSSVQLMLVLCQLEKKIMARNGFVRNARERNVRDAQQYK